MLGLSSSEFTLVAVGTGILVGIALAIILARSLRFAGAKDCWERVAWAFKLSFQGEGTPFQWTMRGKVNGFSVEIKVFTIGAKEPAPKEPAPTDKKKKKKKKKRGQEQDVSAVTRISVVIPSGFPADGTMRRRGRMARLAGPASGILTGDRKFDRLIEVRGTVTEILAHLNERVRRQALETIPEFGVIVEKRRLQWDYNGHLTKSRMMTAMLKALVSLAGALKGNGEKTEHNLLMNCLRDRHNEVRNVSFSTLLTRFVYKNETHRAATSILGASDPITEMIGGMQAGEAGLERVRRSAMSADLPPNMRVRCIEHLIREHPARTGSMVVEMIGPIVGALGESELNSMIELVAQLEPQIAQHALLPFVQTPSVNVQVAALVALGNLGLDEVVPNLQTIIDEPYVDSKVKGVAKQTIAAIRSRALNIDNP